VSSGGLGTRTYDSVAVGDELERLVLPITPPHRGRGDRQPRLPRRPPRRTLAQLRGSPDIFMNILTTNGLVGRFVTDWSGPAAVLRDVVIRLGAPNYPDDTMTLTGIVTAKADPDADGRRGDVEVTVRGANSLGDHVTGTVTVSLPARACGGEPAQLAGKVAIAGIGATEFSKDSGRSELRLAVEAVAGALATPVSRHRGGRHGHLQLGDQPRRRHRRSLALASSPSSAASTTAAGGVRDHPAGRPGRRIGRGRRGRLLPGVQRALGEPLRAGVQDRAPMANAESAHFAFYMPVGLLTPASGWPWRPALPACLGATSEDSAGLAVADRRHAATNPKAWFYGQPSPGRAPGERFIVEPLHSSTAARRPTGPGHRGHLARAGPGPAQPAGRVAAAAQARARART